MLGWFRQNLVLSCSTESITEKKISLVALAEVFFAVSTYWVIAVHFQTHLHLLISVIAAPLLLLRSGESCDTAKRWWGEGAFSAPNKEHEEKIGQQLSPGKAAIWLIIAGTTVITFLFSWMVTTAWLPNYEGISVFWRTAVVGILTLWMTVAATTALSTMVATLKMGVGSGTVLGSAAVLGSGVVASLVVGLIVVVALILVVGAGVGLVVGLVMVVGMVAAVVADEHTGTGAVEAVLVGVLVIPPYTAVFLLLALTIRLASTVKHVIAGIGQWRHNWYRTMLCEDFRLQPALVPGIGEAGTTLQTISGGLKDTFSKNSLLNSTFTFALSVLIWMPAQLWRWSIKSTSWFYAPLYLLLNIGAERSPRKQRHALISSPGLLGWVGMLYAASVLMVAIINVVDWSAVYVQWNAIGNAAPAFSPLSWWFVTDWSKLIDRPWQWFHLAAATLTLVCFFWLDRLRRRRKAAECLGESPDLDYPLDRHPGRTIYSLQRIKQGFVTAAMFTGMLYFAKWAYQFGNLPSWTKPVLGTFFGS